MTQTHPTGARRGEAATFADEHLTVVLRGTGESYADHGREVAATLLEVTADPLLQETALLHDILVHPDGERLLRQSPLSKEGRLLTRRMYKLRRLHIDEHTDDLETVIDAFTDDPRLLFLRMAHRLNDVRHLGRFSPERQKEMAHETLHMYASIAGKLGFHRWRWQMEDTCFLTLEPETADSMRRRFRESQSTDLLSLTGAKAFLRERLQAHGIEAEIDERIKGLYSTHRKILRKKCTFDDITDRLALRIHVPSVDDCYRTLGIIHAALQPMPGKLKDYIADPKQNGYRSLHTVILPRKDITSLSIEIQIRTHEMHAECEFGIASHADYKHDSYGPASRAAMEQLSRARMVATDIYADAA